MLKKKKILKKNHRSGIAIGIDRCAAKLRTIFLNLVVVLAKNVRKKKKKRREEKKFGMEETVNLESQPVGVIGTPMEDREVPRCDRNAFAASPVHRQSQCHKC